MIQVYDKTGRRKLGDLTECIECFVEEERNGVFELTLVYPTSPEIVEKLEKESIIVVPKANDHLLNQKFRVHNIRKLMTNRIEVCAYHISFDLAHDYISSINIEHQSCEYALNTIFRNSQFSQNYRGHSDIINAQDYNISRVNALRAIAGERGSIIDTYGTGAEILRDNTDIHVLNRRGRDNDVTIEYRKNLTGLEVEEDTSELVTRIIPIAKYTEDNEEVEVVGEYIDSPLINNYAHPYVKLYDYSDKFEEGEIPTPKKLGDLAKKEYTVNKVDIPKCNYKIEFIPLSKCAGYEGLEDRINLCDVVTIKDDRYAIDTQAKVIKVKFNVLKERYESMEIGEPRTSLGDIIGGTGSGSDGPTQGPPGPPGPAGPPGADGDIGDFPDSLPPVPIVTSKVYGFANVEISWTFENKVYYSYELYGSKRKGFTPNEFDLIFEGQASTFLHQVNPNETWYYRVCAINTHGKRTEFSREIEVQTAKIEDLSNYVENAAIGDALIGELNLGRGWFGELTGNYMNLKGVSVTDGNGKRTVDIDSFGRARFDVTELKINSESVVSKKETSQLIKDEIDKLNAKLETEISDVENAVGNLGDLLNGSFADGIIDEAEALAIAEHLRRLDTEKADIDAQYEELYNNPSLFVKSELKEAKDVYDQKHTELKTTINTIISDGAFDKETESAQLNQAFTDYNKALAKFKKVAQKAIDAIAEAKKNEAIDESKTYTNAQIKVVNDAITMSVTKVEEIQTTTNQSIANINSALNKVNADLTNSNNTINGVIGDINDLDQTIEGVLNNVNTVITDISKLEKRVQSAEQKVTAEAITSVVSGTYATKTDVTAQINGVTQTITSVQERVNKAEQKITDSAIISTVTSSQTYRDNLSDKVSTNQVISSINQTAERIKISASKIDLQGYITASDLSGTSSTTIDGSNISTGVIKSRDGSFWFDLNNGRMAIYESNKLLAITHKMKDNKSGKYGLGFQANRDSFIALSIADNDDNTIYKPYIALTAKAFGEYKPGINIKTRVEMDYNTLANGALSYNGFKRNSGDYAILYSANQDSNYSKLILELGDDYKSMFEIWHKFYNKDSADLVASFRGAGGSESNVSNVTGIKFFQNLGMQGKNIWGIGTARADLIETQSASVKEIDVQQLTLTKIARFNIDEDIKYRIPASILESIEHFGRAELSDNYCRVNLPLGFNHKGYIVTISPRSSGDYEIIKYDEYFEIKGNIKAFDYILKGFI